MRNAIKKALDILGSDEHLMRADKVQEAVKALQFATEQPATDLADLMDAQAGMPPTLSPIDFDPLKGIGEMVTKLFAVPEVKAAFDSIGSDRAAQHAELCELHAENNKLIRELITVAAGNP